MFGHEHSQSVWTTAEAAVIGDSTEKCNCTKAKRFTMKKRNYIQTKNEYKRQGPVGKVLLCLFVLALLATATLFFYTAYRLTGTWMPTAELFDGKGSVRFVDVGQGDCTLVTWQGDSVLVDAGPASAGGKTAEYLRSYAPRIDLMIITHPHEDHMGGAADILSAVKVDTLLLPSQVQEDTFYKKAIETAQRRGTEILYIDEAYSQRVGSLTVDIFDIFAYPYEDLNDASLITRITMGETTLLVTGDAEEGLESYLVNRVPQEELDADLLKVGHHGSATSTTEAFLRAVSPEICVISAGRNNSYGHPHDTVVNRIEAYGAALYRTDRMGHVVIRGATDSGRGLIAIWKSLWQKEETVPVS